jgi:7-cyano-7-deazaguanine synthase in queuosine biosynthesis
MKNLLVSFSGGETSAFMAQWLNNHYEQLGYENIVFVFANTGLENEQTLEFVERCDKHFRLNIQWIEAEINYEKQKGTTFYRTDFDNASRNGEPFEAMIKKYGIPNQNFPHCTRELKQVPIQKFGKQWFNGEKYHLAIGIRQDEADRINPKSKEVGIIYPLISRNMIPATKTMINFYWRSMPFRLELKGYQGNCTTCWKKGDRKLYQIAKENPKAFDFMDRMEQKYPIGRNGERIVFFRKDRSAKDILEQSKNWNGKIKNDADEYTYQLDLLGGDSCEVFSECGS